MSYCLRAVGFQGWLQSFPKTLLLKKCLYELRHAVTSCPLTVFVWILPYSYAFLLPWPLKCHFFILNTYKEVHNGTILSTKENGEEAEGMALIRLPFTSTWPEIITGFPKVCMKPEAANKHRGRSTHIAVIWQILNLGQAEDLPPHSSMKTQDFSVRVKLDY